MYILYNIYRDCNLFKFICIKNSFRLNHEYILYFIPIFFLRFLLSVRFLTFYLEMNKWEYFNIHHNHNKMINEYKSNFFLPFGWNSKHLSSKDSESIYIHTNISFELNGKIKTWHSNDRMERIIWKNCFGWYCHFCYRIISFSFSLFQKKKTNNSMSISMKHQ